MMVATSESEVIKDFFEAVHDRKQLEPKLDRLESERKTRKRKLRSAKEEIEGWDNQLETQKREFRDVIGAEIPEEEEFEEGTDYEANLRYNRGKEWRGNVRMMVAGDRDFEFRGGAGFSGSDIGTGATPGTTLITAQITDGRPTVEIRYGWSKRSRRNRDQKARSSETYLQRDLNGIAADQEDWMSYWESDVREVVERTIREEVKETLGEDESFDEETLPEVPDPLTIEALWSLFSDDTDNPLGNRTYAGIKKMIGVQPGGRFASEECWQRWTPVIERGLAEGLLSYAHTYQSLASETISEIETKIRQARNQRDLMEKSISRIEEEIEETEERLEEAERQIDDLQGQVNDELASRFRGRGHLYNHLNQIRAPFGIDNEIPKRIVGADYGSDVEEDDEPSDDILTDATIGEVSEEGEGPFNVGDEGEGSGQSEAEPQGETETGPVPSSADAPAAPQEIRNRLQATLETTSEERAGHTIVDTPRDFIAYAETRNSGPGAPVDPAALLEEGREVPGFDSEALGPQIRTIVAESGGAVYSHFGSDFATHLPEPVPYIPSEEDHLRGTAAQGLSNGAYADEMVAVADPIGEDAFDIWMFGFAQRQMRAGNADSVPEVRAQLEEEYGDFDVPPVSETMPARVPRPVEPLGIAVPRSARLRAPGLGSSPPGFSLLDAFLALAPTGGAPSYKEVQYIWADHWQFVMQALTTGSTESVGAGDVQMGVFPEADRQMERPTIYFSTPTGVQAFVQAAASGEPEVDDFEKRSPTDYLFSSGIDTAFADRQNPEGSSNSEGSSNLEGSPEEPKRREMFPTAPIGEGRVRRNPGGEPTDVARVDTDHALSYLARTEPGSFKVDVKAEVSEEGTPKEGTLKEEPLKEGAAKKQVRASEEEVHHIFTDPDGSLLLIVPDRRVQPAHVPEGTAEEAEKMHEEFTHYEADEESMVMDLPDLDPDEAPVVGHAEEIIYESDKVMREGDEKGELHTYVHEFDEGERPVRQWGEVAIVEDVAVDGRGILN
jgi:predicted  nucleic acid-binding Zn-ribbon protein